MIVAFRLLIVLIILSLLFLIMDNLLVRGIFTGYIAIVLLFVALAIRPGEASFLLDIVRPATVFALVPAVWIVLQTIPMPIAALRHPIWVSAEAALGHSLWGTITINQGDTVIALSRYLTAFGLFLVATAVSIHRQRAEIVLLCLVSTTTLFALLLIIHDLGGFIFLGEVSSSGPRASITAAATLDTVLSSATILYAIERYETRRSHLEFNRARFALTVGAALIAFLVALIAVIFFTSSRAIFIALSGVGAFVLIAGFRRIGLGAGMAFILAAVAIAVPLSIIARDLLNNAPDLSIRFVSDGPKSLIELTQRIIADTNWMGSGAGTFASLLPIYEDASHSFVPMVAPTTAAGILIELGWPAMWTAIIVALAAVGWLTRGALNRGRDSFFTAAGAGCAIVLTLEAFVDASLLTSSTIIIAMTVLGLALSQSVSRIAR